ncbi:MAG: integrase domain-containing protein [Pseudohongiellaceae bacterium]|nr:integrase domain-containing protein [Pseudohongiellaceae bacterium]
MANTTKPLTNTEIRLAKPREKEFSLADGKGLYLRVKPTGSKLWIFNYTHPYTKKRANLGLGTYPELSLADARQKALSFKSTLAKGADPKEARDEQRRKLSEAHQNTFEQISRKWLALKKETVSKTYHDKIENRLELYAFPTLGKIPIHKLTAVSTIETIKPLAARGKLETVKRLCRWINEIMVYSVNTGLLHSNPLSGIGKAFSAPKVVNLPTLEPERLPDLMIAINQSRTKIVTRCLIEWQLHTMVRPSEAAGARWEEIDFKNALWTIPAERMKKKRSHIVPLSNQALAILEVLKPISAHREWLFPSDHNPRKSANSQSANRAIKKMGFQGQLVSHGLRALASTTLNEQGFEPDVIEAALAHVDKNSVRAAYNRAKYLEKRRDMMNWWSDHIEKAATGNLSVFARPRFVAAK